MSEEKELKTLKDFMNIAEDLRKQIQRRKRKNPNLEREAMIALTKRNTKLLNYLQDCSRFLGIIHLHDLLKAEAVKWVKYYLERNCEMGGLRGNWEASWIKHFFNLTEEDLK